MRLIAWLSLSIATGAIAWTNAPSFGVHRDHTILAAKRQPSNSRRSFLASGIISAAVVSSVWAPVRPVQAAGKDAEIIGKLSVEDAKKRFQLARKDVAYLMENFDDISSKGGGDAIRNRLGTQGIDSNLFGIQKVLKILQEEADDLVEYSELMEEFNAYYYQAEGAAYQSMFAAFSSSKSTPAQLLATAKKDLITMSKYMDQLAAQLKL